MGLNNNPKEHEDTIYATILADGKIHVAVAEGTEGAIEREYETSAGKKGKKFEHLYTELIGKIQKVEFKEGDYGINLLVTIGEEGDEKPVTLALGTTSNFGEDLMKKLPNIDLKKNVKLEPYSFLNDKQKNTRGIVVTQPNKKGEFEKVYSFYHDNEKKTTLNGYPVQPKPKAGKPVSKVEWRKYFGAASDFLVEDITERFKIEESQMVKDGKKAAREF